LNNSQLPGPLRQGTRLGAKVRIYWVLIIGIFSGLHSLSAEPITIIIPKDVFDDYEYFLNGREPLKITDFSGAGSRRDVVEVVFIQQALHAGGIKDGIKFILANTYARIQQQITSGSVVMAANSIWTSDLKLQKESIHISLPAIESGEFEAGLYTVSTNTKALSAKNLKDVQQLKAVSNTQWTVDWNTLTQLNLKGLESVVKWTTMLHLIKGDRVDFLLAPFQATADFSFTAEGVKFIPIPDLKVALSGSRSFAVSKKHPRGKQVFEAFNKGLERLKEQGIINQAYQQSGFFNQRVIHWKKLN